jgi:hypothetical protein
LYRKVNNCASSTGRDESQGQKLLDALAVYWYVQERLTHSTERRSTDGN